MGTLRHQSGTTGGWRLGNEKKPPPKRGPGVEMMRLHWTVAPALLFVAACAVFANLGEAVMLDRPVSVPLLVIAAAMTIGALAWWARQ
jgi:hypothetical protein